MTSLKTSIKTITYLSDTGCLEIQGASLNTYNKTIIFALYISLYHSQSLAYYIHIMYINNACSQNIFFKCN
ncbi:hypothetical protein AW076_22315 [Escherichia coli]|nr:hypothetical protein AW076_22315 [Escherichia coli]QGU64287.1 hypothetical protein CUC37_14615 [Shigella boydii]